MTDLIEQVLAHTRLRTKLFYQGQHCGHWQFPMIHKNQSVFHLLLQGECKINIKGSTHSILLQEGDLLYITRYQEHYLQSVDYATETRTDQQSYDFSMGLIDEATSLICGSFDFDEQVRNPLLDALPHYVVVRANEHPERNWVKHIIALLIAEANHSDFASGTLMERMIDVFFIHIVRSYLAAAPECKGILLAYNDPHIRKVLEAIHQYPSKPWSLEDFSVLANMSRSSFIERFNEVLNDTPINYLNQLRMELGHRIIRESDKKILEIALECGYESEAAFCRAFKRYYGLTPSELRK